MTETVRRKLEYVAVATVVEGESKGMRKSQGSAGRKADGMAIHTGYLEATYS